MAHAAFLAPSDATLEVTARIGPNAIIQVAEVLRAQLGERRATAVVEYATGYRLEALPQEMIPESEALALTHAVLNEVGETQASAMLRAAGYRTGEYLLRHRIPIAAQRIIRLLPKRAGLALLLKAMARHAWTFAGSGQFRIVTRRNTIELVFTSCAMCRGLSTTNPACSFYAGTFERLISALITPTATVAETECCAQGGHCCRFLISVP